MKVSKYWVYVSMFLIGCIFGMFITAKVFINNIPESTTISIGKMKVRGQNNEITTDVILEETENEVTKRRRKRK